MNLFGVLSEVYPTLLTGLTMTVKITIFISDHRFGYRYFRMSYEYFQ